MEDKDLRDMTLEELLVELKVSYGWREDLIKKLIELKT